MDLFRTCDGVEYEETKPEDAFEYLTDQNVYRLRTEDVISVDSIISEILSLIEPTEVQFKKCDWNISAKEMEHPKKELFFKESLFISQLNSAPCDHGSRTFNDSDLQEIGRFHLSIRESFDGYAIFSSSGMTKNMHKSQEKCGHTLHAKYDNKLILICEKRVEYSYVDGGKIERSLMAENKDGHIVAKRETKLNEESRKFQATIKTKGIEDTFLLDGGVLLLQRYLTLNDICGGFEFYTLNLFGRVLRCELIVVEEKKQIRIFRSLFHNCTCILIRQYFNDELQDVTATYLSTTGRILLHFWNGYRYLLHAKRGIFEVPQIILPNLEKQFKSDPLLLKFYQNEKDIIYADAVNFLQSQPEIGDFLNDFVNNVLKFKPDSLLEFTVRFFQNMKSTF